MKVELIPVIELGFAEEESYFIQPYPDHTYWLNPKYWEDYFEQKVKKNGYKQYTRIKEGYPFYRINQFKSKEDLLKIIRFHIGEDEDGHSTPLEESCALFGGYVLKLDEQIVFTPQCCSLLSDFSTWQSIIQDNFEEGYICLEGHPCPKVQRSGEKLIFTFEEEWEDFSPPAIDSIVDRSELTKAIKICQTELNEFAYKLNSLADKLDHESVADILIYGE